MDSVLPIETGPSSSIETSFEEFFQDHQQKSENEIYCDLPPIKERKQGLKKISENFKNEF